MSLVIPMVLLGLLASLSPTTIVVFILVLATTRARANAAAFLIGWTVSLVVVFIGAYVVGGAYALQQGGGRVTLQILEILLGVLLIIAAGRQWRHRNEPRSASALTRSLDARLDRLNPWEAAIVGVLKEPWALTAAAAVVVTRDHAALLTAIVAFLLFTLVSTTTVGLAYLYYARRPGEAQAHLDDLRARVIRAGPAIAAAVFLLVGGYLVIEGALGLAGN